MLAIIHSQLPLKNPQFSIFNPAYARPSSSSISYENSYREELNKNKTLDFVENAGREGADENSTVGVGDGSESSFFYFYFYFKVFEWKQSNDPEGGNKIVGKTNVAFRDPVELYRELCTAQKE